MTQAEDAAVRCADVAKTYVSGTGDVVALEGVNATFAPGEITAVAGPSGSGKSTLLRLLACMDRPDAGRVEITGVDVARMGARRRRALRRHAIGYVFQEPAANLLGYLTAARQLRLAVRLRGRPAGHAAGGDDPAGLLEEVGLGHRADHLPHRLSGGEQQRLGVASVLAGGPAVVLADEPTAQLDHEAGAGVLEALVQAATRGVAVIVASHDPELGDVADRVLTLADGKLEERGGREATR